MFLLPPNTDFTLFVITTPKAPFVPAWYQGDLTTNASGNGVVDVTGIFSDETFILNPGVPPVPVGMAHLGVWFADPAQEVTAGCPGTVTPFDGDHEAGIQVLNTSNFPDANGPRVGSIAGCLFFASVAGPSAGRSRSSPTASLTAPHGKLFGIIM